MFALVSGLGHGSVSRLRQAWDKVPTKYIKLFEDLQDLMDPSRNMSKYRNLVNSELVSPPLVSDLLVRSFHSSEKGTNVLEKYWGNNDCSRINVSIVPMDSCSFP